MPEPVNDNESFLGRFVVRQLNCVCIFCGATKQTTPERLFVTNGRTDICASCIDEGSFLINNADRLDDSKMVASMRTEFDRRLRE